MTQQLLEKYKAEIKLELIDHYDSLRFRIDKKGQKLQLEKTLSEKSRQELMEENIFLVDQVKRVEDSNLNDINVFFDSLMQNNEMIKMVTTKKNDLANKEEIKKMALKSYLILPNYVWFGTQYDNFGLHIEFDWYINEDQLSFITRRFSVFMCDFYLNKETLLIKYCIEFFKLANYKLKYSYHKMSNPIEVLKILKNSSRKFLYEDQGTCYIDKNTFKLMNNLKCLQIESFGDESPYDFSFVLDDKNNTLVGLENLEYFKLRLGEIRGKNCHFNFPNLKKLKIDFYSITTSSSTSIFKSLNNLIELEISYKPCFQNTEDLDENMLSRLKNLQILRLDIDDPADICLKDLSNLKELYLTCPYHGFVYGYSDKENDEGLNFDNTFKGLTNLKKLVLTDVNVKILNSNIFQHFTSLKELEINNCYLKKIEDDAFKYLEKLEKLCLNDNYFIKMNNPYPFRFLKNLKESETFSNIIPILPVDCLRKINKISIISQFKMFRSQSEFNSIEDLLETFRNLHLSNLTDLCISKIKSNLKSIDQNTFNGFENLINLKLQFEESITI